MLLYFILHFLFSLIIFIHCEGNNNVIYQTDPRTGMIFEVPLPATYITPVKGLATFYNSSTPGFMNGEIQGAVAFFQANFPNNQAVVVDCQLSFPDYMTSKGFALEILLNGDLDGEYCKSGMRFADPLVIKLPRGENFYAGARKRNDISIINHSESIIGRVLRITCVGCEEEKKILGCALIGRVDDEVYVEKDSQFIENQVHIRQQEQFKRAQKNFQNNIMMRRNHRKLLVLA
uniref:Uncharacterized protein n=1 Tax=Parastrongyloides trichosuri TaxID=131310 RepID=A0A0N4ZA72_PARTI